MCVCEVHSVTVLDGLISYHQVIMELLLRRNVRMSKCKRNIYVDRESEQTRRRQFHDSHKIKRNFAIHFCPHKLIPFGEMCLRCDIYSAFTTWHICRTRKEDTSILKCTDFISHPPKPKESREQQNTAPRSALASLRKVNRRPKLYAMGFVEQCRCTHFIWQ